jgi:guanylate kinase
MSNPAVLIVISGPAGSGKSTLCDRLVRECPEFSRVVTTTTRPPREDEVNGVHYHFFSPAEFRTRIQRGDFLEWAQVHGNQDDRLYGTLKTSVVDPIAAGRSLVMSIDVQGVANLRRFAASDPQLSRALTTVFILVDRERLVARMRLRAQDHDEEIERRMATAEAEIRAANTFDFRLNSQTRDEDFAALLEIVAAARAKATRE